MRKTIHKCFGVWEFDKEEKWLNEMAVKGMSLVAVGFCTYIFEEGISHEYNICLELFENIPAHTESRQYIKFVEETGAEYLGQVMRWGYFRKKKDSGKFDLYSDVDSRIKYLDRIITLLAVIALAEIGIGISNIWIYASFHHLMPNLAVGASTMSLGLLVGLGALRINSKKQKLKKEKQLFE